MRNHSRNTVTVAAIAALAGLLAESSTANAQTASPIPTTGYSWYQVSPGCASAIAVGPNNIPWILGCGNPSEVRPVYYLSQSCTGSFFCPVTWQYAGMNAMTLTVNLNGVPFVTDANGTVWSVAESTASIDPGSQWEPVTLS